VDLTYGQVEALLGRLHRVHSGNQIALMGRLKHFKRLGFPEGTNLGRGARVKYDARRTMLLVAAFEMLQFGLTPERAANLLTRVEVMVSAGFVVALLRNYGLEASGPHELLEVLPGGSAQEHVFLVFDPHGLFGLRFRQAADWENVTPYTRISTASALPMVFDDQVMEETARRRCLLNLTVLLEDVMFALDRQSRPDEMAEWLREWVSVSHGEAGSGHDPQA
jgi:hypothetical protein